MPEPATHPACRTGRLLGLAIAGPECAKWLADQAGEWLPLWQQRQRAQPARRAGDRA